jgi:chromosome segregation ATPase
MEAEANAQAEIASAALAEAEANAVATKAALDEAEAKSVEFGRVVGVAEVSRQHLEATNVELEAKNVELEARNMELEAALAAARVRIAELAASLADLQSHLDAVAAEKDALSASDAQLQAERVESQKEVDDMAQMAAERQDLRRHARTGKMVEGAHMAAAACAAPDRVQQMPVASTVTQWQKNCGDFNRDAFLYMQYGDDRLGLWSSEFT